MSKTETIEYFNTKGLKAYSSKLAESFFVKVCFALQNDYDTVLAYVVDAVTEQKIELFSTLTLTRGQAVFPHNLSDDSIFLQAVFNLFDLQICGTSTDSDDDE